MWRLKTERNPTPPPLKMQFSVNYEMLEERDSISRAYNYPFDTVDYQVSC